MRIFKYILPLLMAVSVVAQVPSPQVPLTGTPGAAGNFPFIPNGTFSIPTDANYTVAYPNTSCVVCVITSSVSLTATRNLVEPGSSLSQMTYNITNATTGGQSIQVIAPSGSGVTIANGTSKWVYFNGTNYVEIDPPGSGGGCTLGTTVCNAGTSTQTVTQSLGTSLNVNSFNKSIFANGGTIENAVAACNSVTPCLITNVGAMTQSTSGTYNVPTGIVLVGQPGSSLTPGAGNTTNFANALFTGPPVAFFTGAGTISELLQDRPEWFCASQVGGVWQVGCMAAAMDATATWGTVALQNSIYQTTHQATHPLHILGVGRPVFDALDSTVTKEVTGTGTIIQGCFVSFAPNEVVTVENAGLDNGPAFQAAFPSLPNIAFCTNAGGVPATYAMFGDHVSIGDNLGVYLKNVRILQKGASGDSSHTVIIENADGYVVRDVEVASVNGTGTGQGGTHVFIDKSSNGFISNLYTWGGSADNFLGKSDYATSADGNYQNNHISNFTGGNILSPGDNNPIAILAAGDSVHGNTWTGVTLNGAVNGIEEVASSGTVYDEVYNGVNMNATSQRGIATAGAIKSLSFNGVNIDMENAPGGFNALDLGGTNTTVNGVQVFSFGSTSFNAVSNTGLGNIIDGLALHDCTCNGGGTTVHLELRGYTFTGITGTGPFTGAAIDTVNNAIQFNGQAIIPPGGWSWNVLGHAFGTPALIVNNDLSGIIFNMDQVGNALLGGTLTFGAGGTTIGNSGLICLSSGGPSCPGAGGITALTGDGTASGPGSAALTLATVNGSPGSCGDATHVCRITTNGKGLTTSQTAVSITAGTGNTTSTALTTNKLPKANGANSIIDSSVSDDGTTVSTPEQFNATGGLLSGTPSTAAKAALPTGARGMACDETTTAGVPAAGVDYIRCDATTHTLVQSVNGGAEATIGSGGSATVIQVNGTPTTTATPVNLQTSTANTVGLTITPSNPSVGNVKLEITGGSYTGTAANLSGTPALPNGTTATTQTVGDNTTKLATDAFVIANASSSGVSSLTGDAILFSNLASTGAVTLTPRTAATNSALLGPCTGGTGAFSFRGLCQQDITAVGTLTNGTTGNAASSTFSATSESLLPCADTSGSGTAQSCTTTPSFAIVANTCITYTTTTANSGAGLTLNVNSLGAKSVTKWMGSTTTLAANDVLANKSTLACYDGTTWELSDIGNAPSGGGAALSGITAATGANTIANGNNGLQIWNWAPTTNQNQFQFGETTAATNGTLGSQYILSAKTLAGSTAVPFAIINSLTGTQTLPSLHITPTWNVGTTVVDAAILVNVTNTASGATSKLIDLQIGGTTEFNVDRTGAALFKAGITGTTIALSSTATLTTTNAGATPATISIINTGTTNGTGGQINFSQWNSLSGQFVGAAIREATTTNTSGAEVTTMTLANRNAGAANDALSISGPGDVNVLAGHITFAQVTAPVVSSCGGGTIGTGSTDNAFFVTGITAATSCTVTFNRALKVGACSANTSTGIATGAPPSTTVAVFAMAALTGSLTAVCF